MIIRIPKTKPNDGALSFDVEPAQPLQFRLAKVKTITIPSILDGDNSGDIVIFTDADYIVPALTNSAIMLINSVAPPSNLAWPLAWLTSNLTGEVTARFFAVGGNVTGAGHVFFCVQVSQ